MSVDLKFVELTLKYLYKISFCGWDRYALRYRQQFVGQMISHLRPANIRAVSWQDMTNNN